MKKLLAAIALMFVSQLACAETAAPVKPPGLQQQRMRECNAQAKDMKGEERKAFMKQCLSGKLAEAKAARAERRAERQNEREKRREERQAARQSQQEKMKTCNAKAKGMKGDERKAFISDCLKS